MPAVWCFEANYTVLCHEKVDCCTDGDKPLECTVISVSRAGSTDSVRCCVHKDREEVLDRFGG
jgi:hypothetical protein